MAPTKQPALLFNPRSYDPSHLDAETQRLLQATIDWFEGRGKRRIIKEDLERRWYAEFLEFVRD